MSLKRRVVFLLTLAMILAMAAPGLQAQEPITLTVLTHWGEERLLEAQQAMIDEYTAMHPEVTIELQTVPFEELLTRIVTSRTAGTSPDIYHLYNLWLPEFTNSGLLAPAPAEVQDLVNNSSAATSIEGVTYDDLVWGIPTEVNTYLLLYNKRLLEEAGYTEPPQTFEEIVQIAQDITQVDDTGAVTQVGFGVLTGWDSGVVHPYMSLLFANGGEYFNDDFSEVVFGNEAGLEVLQLYQDLLDTGGMDMSIAGWEFPNNQVGMIVMANWWRATLQASENIDYDTEVGVAEIPVGPSGSETSTLAYNWLWGVDAGSPNQEAAWAFVQWMNTPRAEGESSPMGDFLVNDLGAIPSLLPDQEAYSEDLGDHFLAPFVASTEYARQEPLIGGSQEIKTMLQTEIEALFTGMTDPQSVIDFVVPEANVILEEFRMATSE